MLAEVDSGKISKDELFANGEALMKARIGKPAAHAPASPTAVPAAAVAPAAVPPPPPQSQERRRVTCDDVGIRDWKLGFGDQGLEFESPIPGPLIHNPGAQVRARS